MVAEERDAGTNLALRRARRKEDNPGIKRGCGLRLVCWGINRAGARWAAGALFGDSRKALLIAGPLSRPVHPARAVMLAVSAAAGREIRFGIGGGERRNQRPTEEQHQRNCDGAAHSQATV